jgi:DNA transposition AAA+ family ATPase
VEFTEHKTRGGTAVEIKAEEIVIQSEQDALDLMANISYLHDSGIIIVNRQNLGRDFFDLSSGLAGGILQKFSNYRVRLFVVGDFSEIESNSLKEFILESNKGRQVNFVADTSQAIEILNG